jgi:hypothetical protein
MNQPKQRPFSIKIFVPDGDPDGLRLVEKSNWTGIGVVFNRSIYKDVSQRPEFVKTGVYALIGSTDGSALPTIYIGEGDPVKDRISSHYSQKDFWDWSIFFVSKDNSLNKAHVKYLESRLLELSIEAKRCKLDNDKTSLPPSLSEAEIADMESFLADMLSIYPLLGLGVFEKPDISDRVSNILMIKTKGISAKGFEDKKGFVVCKDSQVVKEEVPSIPSSLTVDRKDLLEQNIIKDIGDHYLFTKDHVFSSPSTAAGVVMGRSANGRLEWKNKEGKTLKEIQILEADNLE